MSTTAYEQTRRNLEEAAETMRRLQVVRNHAWAIARCVMDGDYGPVGVPGGVSPELFEECELLLERIASADDPSAVGMYA